MIQQNAIGSDPLNRIPGTNYGVLISASGNTVGDPTGTSGLGNIIGFTNVVGIEVAFGIQDVFRGNTFVGANGSNPTPSINDIFLAPGGNNNQPAPTLQSATLNGTQLTVQFTVRPRRALR